MRRSMRSPVSTVLTCLFLVGSVHGFGLLVRPEATPANTRLWSTLQEEDRPNPLGRRDVLAYASSSAMALLVGSSLLSNTDNAPTTTTPLESASSFQSLTTIDQVMDLLEARCDRRFLHAVVASDYRLLYTKNDASKRSSEALVVDSSLHQDATTTQTLKATDFAPYFDISTNTGPFHKTTTLRNSNSQEYSFWPLDVNVHFAWPQELSQPQQLIVDGVDCGVMSLEDALERPQGPVVVYSNAYLLVPRAMQDGLVEKLKGSFII